MGLRIEEYNSSFKAEWDDFISKAKNSHFIFYRDYMEYHSERFQDFSLLFFDDKGRLVAILAANKDQNTLYSHQGLSFGGFIIDSFMKTKLMLDLFESLISYLKAQNINKLIYKAMPHIYCCYPSEEDRYALFINQAKIFRIDTSSTIFMKDRIPYQERRLRAVKKAKKANLKVERSFDFKAFWGILGEVLDTKYSRKPVHSLEEIILLSERFPDNIKLFLAQDIKGQTLAGTIIYENSQIAHAQYLANSEVGKEMGALDLTIDYLLNDYYTEKRIFDFGISNEDNGEYLNEGLIEQKEGFGARTIVHEFYELEL